MATIKFQLHWGLKNGILFFDKVLILKSGAFRGPLKELKGAMKELGLSQLIIMNPIALQMSPGLQKCNISKSGVFRGHLKEAQGGP